MYSLDPIGPATPQAATLIPAQNKPGAPPTPASAPKPAVTPPANDANQVGDSDGPGQGLDVKG